MERSLLKMLGRRGLAVGGTNDKIMLLHLASELRPDAGALGGCINMGTYFAPKSTLKPPFLVASNPTPKCGFHYFPFFFLFILSFFLPSSLPRTHWSRAPPLRSTSS